MMTWTNVFLLCASLVFALSPSAMALQPSSRRAFFNKVAATTVASVGGFGAGVSPGVAAPQIFTTKNGVKYAVLKKEGKDNTTPQDKDIVAIEYTGYLTDGSIFGTFKEMCYHYLCCFVLPNLMAIFRSDTFVDATHSEGKKVRCLRWKEYFSFVLFQ